MAGGTDGEMWLLLIFLALPIVEIALFIEVGGLIGLWPTLGLVLLAALAGRGGGAPPGHAGADAAARQRRGRR